MLSNKRFNVTITLTFDVRETDVLCGDKLHDYTVEDWRENYKSILEDKGVSEFLPKPHEVEVVVEEV